MLHLAIPYDQVSEAEIYGEVSLEASVPKQATLAALHPDVLLAYDDYASAGHATQLGSFLSHNLQGEGAKALRGNYTILRSGECKEIGARILRRSKKCCLCGHRDVGQLDHYLPLSIFPEFSAFTLNLVPVCAECNKTKLNTYLRADGGPAFLHAYRDELPAAEQFLVAQVAVDDTVAVDFSVAHTPSVPASVFETLQSHFDLLDLANLYGGQSTEMLFEKLVPLYEHAADGGPEEVRRYLEREARGAAARRGPNHWKPVALQALAASDEFCDGGFTALGPPDDLYEAAGIET